MVAMKRMKQSKQKKVKIAIASIAVLALIGGGYWYIRHNLLHADWWGPASSNDTYTGDTTLNSNGGTASYGGDTSVPVATTPSVDTSENNISPISESTASLLPGSTTSSGGGGGTGGGGEGSGGGDSTPQTIIDSNTGHFMQIDKVGWDTGDPTTSASAQTKDLETGDLTTFFKDGSVQYKNGITGQITQVDAAGTTQLFNANNTLQTSTDANGVDTHFIWTNTSPDDMSRYETTNGITAKYDSSNNLVNTSVISSDGSKYVYTRNADNSVTMQVYNSSGGLEYTVPVDASSVPGSTAVAPTSTTPTPDGGKIVNFPDYLAMKLDKNGAVNSMEKTDPATKQKATYTPNPDGKTAQKVVTDPSGKVLSTAQVPISQMPAPPVTAPTVKSKASPKSAAASKSGSSTIGLPAASAPAAAPAVGTFFGNNLPDYISNLYDWALVIGTGLAIIMIMWAGTKFIISAGDPEGVRSAKDYLTGAIIGLILLILTATIAKTLGVKSINSVTPATTPAKTAAATTPSLAAATCEINGPVVKSNTNNFLAGLLGGVGVAEAADTNGFGTTAISTSISTLVVVKSQKLIYAYDSGGNLLFTKPTNVGSSGMSGSATPHSGDLTTPITARVVNGQVVPVAKDAKGNTVDYFTLSEAATTNPSGEPCFAGIVSSIPANMEKNFDSSELATYNGVEYYPKKIVLSGYDAGGNSVTDRGILIHAGRDTGTNTTDLPVTNGCVRVSPYVLHNIVGGASTGTKIKIFDTAPPANYNASK